MVDEEVCQGLAVEVDRGELQPRTEHDLQGGCVGQEDDRQLLVVSEVDVGQLLVAADRQSECRLQVIPPKIELDGMAERGLSYLLEMFQLGLVVFDPFDVVARQQPRSDHIQPGKDEGHLKEKRPPMTREDTFLKLLNARLRETSEVHSTRWLGREQRRLFEISS